MSPSAQVRPRSTRATGVALAFTTALISGVSIYTSSFAVKHFHDQTVFTTAKNGIAGILLLTLVLARPRAQRDDRPRGPMTPRRWGALLGVGVIGGSVPFVLFFEGLAHAEATQASFIQKTMVVWVALLAVPLLRERFGLPHLLAIFMLIAGQAWLVGRTGTVAWGSGETMIFAATLLWAVEVVFVKHLLADFPARTLAVARMGIGSLLLVTWVVLTGKLGALSSLNAEQWRWVLLTGLLLTGYVATWYAALARAQAVDVTAVLTFGAVVTAVLSGAADGAPVSAIGVALVAAGAAIIAVLALRQPRAAASTS